MKILCIDDSKAVHAFLKDCLTGVATEFKSAFDGEQAVKLFEDKSFSADLIFLDWEMPKKTGPEVLADLARAKNTIPIIMLTSKNQTSDIAAVLAAGASEYIMKPFTKDIILEKVSMLVGAKT